MMQRQMDQSYAGAALVEFTIWLLESNEKNARLTSLGFGGTTKVSITQLPTELRRWVLDIYDVDMDTFKVGPEMTLKITEEDVHKVYELPRVRKK
ncbi:hypothetical protein LINPERPRIM_LOCUS40507 [Linum perenne]